MEPVGTGKNLRPVKFSRAGQVDAGVFPVIEHLGGTLVGAGLDIVDAETARPQMDQADIDTKAAQLA